MNQILSRLTPYDDLYQTCERTCAKLLIYLEDIEPLVVTQWLGLEPTELQKKGEKLINKTGQERVTKRNYWFLSSEDKVSSLDLRRHLDWLLGQVEPASEQLIKLQMKAGVKMTIRCIWWSAYAQGGPTLWPEQMKKMAMLNLECGFDIAFFGDDE